MRVSKGLLLGWVLALFPLQGMAITFDFDVFGTRVDSVINNAATFGYSWRLHDQATDLIGKGNLDPNVCGDQFQLCQGLHRLQSFPAERLAAAPGQPSINFDDGNLNYDKGDVTQAPFKLTQDIRFLFGNYGIFYRAISRRCLTRYRIDRLHLLMLQRHILLCHDKICDGCVLGLSTRLI